MPRNASDFDIWTGEMLPKTKKPKPIPAGCRAIKQPKPRCSYYSYSNPNSQEALICETRGFPHYVPKGMRFREAYSDRIRGWDSDRYTHACAIAGGGDQSWGSCLPLLSDDQLREFAKAALNLKVTPLHVRVVHWYNVSSGYSCPTVAAIEPDDETTG